MASTTYRVRIVRNGQETEVEGDKNFVLEMLGQLEPSVASKGGERKSRNTSQSDGKGTKEQSTASKLISIREFIQQLEFKKHTDITLAFGYYIEHYTETHEFTPADINNCYYEAKIEGSNTSQMIIQNIRRGFMMPAKGKSDSSRKRYTLTNSGEKFVETALGGGA